MIEARLESRRPIVVTEHAANLDQAFNGALDKLSGMVESI